MTVSMSFDAKANFASRTDPWPHRPPASFDGCGRFWEYWIAYDTVVAVIIGTQEFHDSFASTGEKHSAMKAISVIPLKTAPAMKVA
jgi:hypothetical protein